MGSILGSEIFIYNITYVKLNIYFVKRRDELFLKNKEHMNILLGFAKDIASAYKL